MDTPHSNIEFLLREVALFRPDLTAKVEKLKQGSSHTIYVVHLQGCASFIARVANQDGSVKLERRAVCVREHLKSARPGCKVPNLLWHNLARSHDPPLIVLEELVKGDSLSVWNLHLQRPLRCTFLGTLSDFLLDLWSVGVPAAEPRQHESYRAWLEAEIDRAIYRCVRETARWGDTSHYLEMRSMIPRLAGQVDEYPDGGIAHGDMNAHNFIVDEQMRLQGVVDWDWAYTAPLPAVVHFPWFIADVPGWHNDGVSVVDTFEDDRTYLVKALRDREYAQGRGNALSKLLSTSRERQIFQASIHFKDIHAEFAKSALPSQAIPLQAVKHELDLFIGRHPELYDATEVKRIKKM